MKAFYSILGLCFISVLFSGCGMMQNGAMIQAQSGIASGDYNRALIALTEAANYKKPAPALGAQITYLKGVCYDGIGLHDDAKALYKFVANHYSDTEYGYMARVKLTNNDGAFV